LAEQEAHKADMAKVDAARKAVTEMNERYKAHADRVALYNERTEAVKEMTGMQAERELKRLANERNDLQKSQADLEAARAAMPNTTEVFNSFNARAKALEARATAWNQRNEALTARVRTVNNEREVWLTDCADRRYREEDEIAIKRGQ
jgi:capsule polysaccharide export protein KpsE/RkpR